MTKNHFEVDSSYTAPELEIFPGIIAKFLPSSNKIMMILVEIPHNQTVPLHKHHNEQLGFCIKGKAEFKFGNQLKIVESGSGYCIPPNMPHSVKVISKETGIFLDIFNPPREDYLKRLTERI